MTTDAGLRLLTPEEIAELDPEQMVAYAESLQPVLEALGRASWRRQARPEQIPPDDQPCGVCVGSGQRDGQECRACYGRGRVPSWSIFALFGGRGSGKTWAAARVLLELIEDDPLRESEGAGDWAIVAPTFSEARDKCVEGEAGILAALGTTRVEVEAKQSATVKTWNRSTNSGELLLHDGTRILIDGAADGATSIQGENLRGCWTSELGQWRNWDRAYDESIGFAVRKGQARIVVEGTPKRILPARKLIRRLLDQAKSDPKTVVRRLRTYDNTANLSPAFLARVRVWEGTSLGQQELEGRLLEDVEGALWRQAWFDQPGFRAYEVPVGGWQRPITGVDPSDGTDEGAAHAYTTVAKALDNLLYVVESEEVRGSTTELAEKVIRHSQAIGSIIVVERNHGGQWLMDVFRRVMIDLGIQRPIKDVWASKGKTTRADPVSALYEPRDLGDGKLRLGRVRHYREHEALEDQMTGWSGAPGEPSPDLLDSAVWALSEFTGETFDPPPPESEDRAVPWNGGRGVEGGAVPFGGPPSTPGTWGYAFGGDGSGDTAVPWEPRR